MILRTAISLLLALTAFSSTANSQTPPPEELEIVGEGAAAISKDLAAVEEEAIWDAKRNAVEQAAGIFLRKILESINYFWNYKYKII